MKTRLPRFALALLLAAAAPLASAQAWPSKPIRLLVPLAAGSTADILSRTIGNELAKETGQAVVVDNKPGAGGTIAMAELARSAPDGYTIEFASQGTLVFNQALYSKPGYGSLKDLSPIGLTGGVSNVMIVPPNAAAREPRAVIEEAKAKPGVLTFSSGGSGTSHHLSGVLFGQLTAPADRHGFRSVKSQFWALHQAMLRHLVHEESVVFPDCKRLDIRRREFEPVRMQGPVQRMNHDHGRLAELQAALKVQMGDLSPQPAEGTGHRLFAELEAYCEDLSLHTRLEDKLLFPAMLQREHVLRRAGGS